MKRAHAIIENVAEGVSYLASKKAFKSNFKKCLTQRVSDVILEKLLRKAQHDEP